MVVCNHSKTSSPVILFCFFFPLEPVLTIAKWIYKTDLLVDNISLQNIEPVLRCHTEDSETYVKFTVIVSMSVKTKTVSANFVVTSSIKSYKPINTGIDGSSKHKRMFKKRDFKSIDKATELTDASRLNKSRY
jgi:hypothetical protein